jgi:hypothetical protein
MPADKPVRVTEGQGLYIEVSPAGSKLWRFKFRFDGIEKRLALGQYPTVGLKEARDAVHNARKQIHDGIIDPSQKKKAAKATRALVSGNTFEVIAREWFAKFSKPWSLAHTDRVWRRIDRDLLPWLGNRPIADITAPELLGVLRKFEASGSVETAHRARSDFSVIAWYAIATGGAERDFAADLRGAIAPVQKKHFAS